MTKQKVVEVRAHTELIDAPDKTGAREGSGDESPQRWTRAVLVLDCETTIDQYQSLTFGTYQYCRFIDGVYSLVEEGVFYADDLDVESISILQKYSQATRTL